VIGRIVSGLLVGLGEATLVVIGEKWLGTLYLPALFAVLIHTMLLIRLGSGRGVGWLPLGELWLFATGFALLVLVSGGVVVIALPDVPGPIQALLAGAVLIGIIWWVLPYLGRLFRR